MDRKKDAILKATAALTENYKNEELFMPKNGRSLPSRAVIIDVVKELACCNLPGIFLVMILQQGIFPEYYTGYRLNDLYDRLKEQIEIALLYAQSGNGAAGGIRSRQIVSAVDFLNSSRKYRRDF